MSYTDVFGSRTVPPSELQYSSFSLSGDITLYFPYTSDGTDIFAAINEVTASVAGVEITLPDATTGAVGYDAIIRNVGAESFDVLSSGGASLTSIAPGEVKYFYLTNNATAAGTWRVFTYGTGTSGADASALAGPGLATLTGTLTTNSTVTTSASDLLLNAVTHRAGTVVFTAGSVTCTLPSTSGISNGWFVSIRNSGTGTVTVVTVDASNIDGQSTKEMAPDESADFICSGTEWYTVGFGRSANFIFTKLVLDVSAGGTFTLTSAQASNKLLQFIGTPVSNVTVEVPAVTSVYYIQCAYSGSFNLSLTTALGSGVSLSNNDRIIAYCDAVDVVSAQSVAASTVVSLTDGSASNPSLYFASSSNTGIYKADVGTLGIAAGGVASVSFSSTLANFGVKVNLPSGNAAAPSVYFNGEATTGIYRKASNSIGISASGVEVAFFNSTGINGVIGAGTAAAGSFTTVSASSTVTATGAITGGSLTDGTITVTGGVVSGVVTVSGTPNFTGAATGQTAAYGDSSTKFATTAYVVTGFTARTSATGAAILPTGTTAQRPGSPASGYIRFNSTTVQFEGYNGTGWGTIGGGATGGGTDQIFYLNGQTVSSNYTVPSGQNAMTTGPITISDGVTVTVPDGSQWIVL